MRILLAEEREGDAARMADGLRRLGHEVSVLREGREVLDDVARTHAGRVLSAGRGQAAPLADDPSVQHWQHPCEKGGYDLLLASRTPGGVLHVLMANAGEDGLAAFVSLDPVIAPFSRMTEKGFKLGTIARELNRKLHASLQPGTSLPAQLVALDSLTGSVSAWNGGMPPAVILDSGGREARRFSQVGVPLGALPDETFEDRVEVHAVSGEDQVVLASDGLLSAADRSGAAFGERRLLAALEGPRNGRRPRAVTAVQAHLAGAGAGDAISLMLIDCASRAVSSRETALPAEAIAGDWGFSLRLAGGEIRHVDVVPLLLGVATQFPAARARQGEIFLILAELFNNALDHGLLDLDSRLKHSPDGMEEWLSVRAERLAELDAGEIRLLVEQVAEEGRPCLRICCSDSGKGFDAAAKLDSSRRRLAGDHVEALPSGRGLALVESMADALDIGARGNDIRVLLWLEDRPPAGESP